MAIDDQFYIDVLESNKDAVRNTVKDALLLGLTRQLEWELPNAVKDVVAEFIRDEVVPQIKADLEANKAVFVNAATEMVKAAPIEISKAMQEQLAKNLANSWQLRKVVEACFS